jgi:phosphatidylserine decarboxylase
MILLTRYGIREWLGGAFIAFPISAALIVLAIVFDFWWMYFPAVFFLLIWFCIAAFFRDPKRVVPVEEGILLSPADGHIKDIKLLENCEHSAFFGEKPVLMIGIFLSVLDVHLNRAPCSITVSGIKYKKGKYYDARDVRASKENESNTLLCEATVDKHTFPIAIKQVSGAIARRIVCPVEPKDKFLMGDKFGMIKFGSRTELHLPSDLQIELLVKEGDKVSAGTTILARIKNK